MRPLKLNPTFAELYPQGRSFTSIWTVGSSDIDLTPLTPRNIKYLYQGRREFNNGLPLGVSFLSVAAQRTAFVCGKMSIVLIDCNPLASAELIDQDRMQVRTTFSVLDPSVRPQVQFYPDIRGIPTSTTLFPSMPVDVAEKHDQIISPETHYKLYSRQGLMESGLPTPGTRAVYEPSLMPQTCCNSCSAHDSFADGCSGTRSDWLAKQTDEVLKTIRSQILPFVMKTQQSYGGGGVFLVYNEKDREDLGNSLKDILGHYLPKLNAENQSLNPLHMYFLDMIEPIKENYSLTFFVKASGDHVWFCAAQQLVNGNANVGATAYYSQQPTLQARCNPLLRQAASYLHRHGYFGPVGMDVLEDSEGRLYVVDLNVRATSSHPVGPILNWSHEAYGYEVVTLDKLSVKLPRKAFNTAFAKRMDAGQIIIIAWYEKGDISFANFALAATGIEEIEVIRKEIEAYKASVEEVAALASDP